jgi:hypothetical protein
LEQRRFFVMALLPWFEAALAFFEGLLARQPRASAAA